MIEIPILLKASDAVLGWFGLLRKEQAERSERERNALKALYAAVMETSMYFRRLENPQLAKTKSEQKDFKRDIQREEALARLWTEASVELRDVNPDLAQRCFFKAQYWTDRDTWTEADVHQTNIALQRLAREARELIHRPV
jgi:hypothetical protein